MLYTVIGLLLDDEECVVDQVECATPASAFVKAVEGPAYLSVAERGRRRAVYFPLVAYEGAVHVQHLVQDLNVAELPRTGASRQVWTVIGLEMTQLRVGVLTVDAPTGPHAAAEVYTSFNNDLAADPALAGVDGAAAALVVVAVLFGDRSAGATVFDPYDDPALAQDLVSLEG